MTSRSDLDPRTSRPSGRVWASAMAGLFGLAGACGDDPKAEPDPTPDAPVADAAVPDMAPDAGPESKIISETPGQFTFAELTAMCDQRGGYVEIYASCSGTNSCAGFSYGDWGEDGVLTEHSCNAVSGCNGMGCVVLPADTGKTAVDILGAMLPDTEGVAQRSCNYCHAEWNDVGFDATKFRVHVPPGSPRNLTNWLDRTAEEQARIIAFGSHVQVGGVQLANMAGYAKMYSRAEIERVVQYIRTTATPVLAETKLADQVTLRRANRPNYKRAKLVAQ